MGESTCTALPRRVAVLLDELAVLAGTGSGGNLAVTVLVVGIEDLGGLIQRHLSAEVCIRGFNGTRCSMGPRGKLGMIVYLHISRCTGYYMIFRYQVPLNTGRVPLNPTYLPQGTAQIGLDYYAIRVTRA